MGGAQPPEYRRYNRILMEQSHENKELSGNSNGNLTYCCNSAKRQKRTATSIKPVTALSQETVRKRGNRTVSREEAGCLLLPVKIAN